MVSWYDPLELMRSARDVFISTILGRHSDHRLLEALAASGEAAAFDCTMEPLPWSGAGPFWLDYLSDTGDGFNPAYAMAACAASPLSVKSPDGCEFDLERGAVLVDHLRRAPLARSTPTRSMQRRRALRSWQRS